MEHERVGQIFFLHVLNACAGGGDAGVLLEASVNGLRGQGVEGIACEAVVFNPAGPLPHLEDVGFERFARAIMRGPLDDPSLRTDAEQVQSRPITPSDLDAVASCLADAYIGDSGTRLHREMATADGARKLVETVCRGAFGEFRSGFARCVEVDGRVESALLGCEAVPGVGFVVQVATRRDARGHGLAAQLIRETALVFRIAGLEHIALGVTLNNPAKRLYERLGMTVRRPVDAYMWWRENNFEGPTDVAGGQSPTRSATMRPRA
jgi:ribosomal protein S18 acetylase RimI-like enzyme